MNLIAVRPRTWNEIVGQERPLTVLRCILTTARFMPRGYIFKGPVGVGKTITAYQLSRSLMCLGKDPMGCGTCISCKLIDSGSSLDEGLNSSGNFVEVDAASKTGVAEARSLLDIMNSPPSEMSKRRVIVIDEAHRLSEEAWDVYLKPLETNDTDSIFIFVSSQAEGIPAAIVSRLVPITFERVHTDSILGLLVNLANQHSIEYELDGLKLLARMSKGTVRDAVKGLGVVGSMGVVTEKLVAALMDNSLEDLCNRCYASLVNNDQAQAVRWIDEAGRNHNTSKVIETLFSIYARTPWADPGTLNYKIASRLPNTREVGAIFLKWSTGNGLPADVLPLIIYELMSTLDVPANVTQRSKGSSPMAIGQPPVGETIPADSIENFLNI